MRISLCLSLKIQRHIRGMFLEATGLLKLTWNVFIKKHNFICTKLMYNMTMPKKMCNTSKHLEIAL